ncbi:MAG: protein TolR [Candidatus Magnetoovum sp. WYHC-5]|nr:protein TolR [Candidatus Magnetoovum sp. WYHC-5]
MKIQKDRAVLSEINVTPFVDVMLVLLIIFMVTAPLMKQGLDIDLPKTEGTALESDQDRFTITVKKDGSLYLNETLMSDEDLKSKLEAISKKNPEVYLEADENVPYGKVAEVMAEINSVGIIKVGMVTHPKEK